MKKSESSTEKDPKAKALDPTALGNRVRQLRQGANMSQRQLATAAGISFSAISKIENSLLSPTYDSLLRLVRGLGCDLTDLFRDAPPKMAMARRSITKRGRGIKHPTDSYDYELLCNDLSHKKMTPIRAKIKARSIEKVPPLTHEGEELIFVISGTIEVHTQFYQPARLTAGDCIYFDSTMEHACVNKSDEDAEVFWVSSNSPMAKELMG